MLAGTAIGWGAVAGLFELIEFILFGFGVGCSLGRVWGLVEHRIEAATFLKTPYFSAVYSHPQGVGADPEAGCGHRQRQGAGVALFGFVHNRTLARRSVLSMRKSNSLCPRRLWIYIRRLAPRYGAARHSVTRNRSSIHRILRLGRQTPIGPAELGPSTGNGAVFLKFLRPFLAIYGTGIAGTFAWLFFTLSGTAACASSAQSCRIVIGLTGQLALVWPAYWGGRITGDAAMTPLIPIEVVAIAILVFVAVLLLAQAYTFIGRSSSPPERIEPLILTSEPNRRNQSRPSQWVSDAGSTPP